MSQQTPDSHDWLEYMLIGDPSGSGIPANMSQGWLGVLDHFSIGGASVDEAFKTLKDGQPSAGVKCDAHPRSARTARASSTYTIPTAPASS